MAEILKYLNALDQNAIILAKHKKNPIQSMSEFGLCEKEQAIFLSGNNEKIAEHVGIAIDAFSSHAPELNIVTY